MIVTIDTNTPNAVPPVAFETDQEYVQYVMSNAARSYQAQYGTATADEGIAAARLAYNAGIPQPEPPPVADEPAPVVEEPAPVDAPAAPVAPSDEAAPAVDGGTDE
jgi:hypothetical protein